MQFLTSSMAIRVHQQRILPECFLDLVNADFRTKGYHWHAGHVLGRERPTRIPLSQGYSLQEPAKDLQDEDERALVWCRRNTEA
jgi:rhodanese-related sulfurtransferase